MRNLRTALMGVVSLAALSSGSDYAFAAGHEQYFERVTTYPVYKTLPAGVDMKTETVAEIISASDGGNTLVFTDSPGEALVFIDITNPANVKSLGRTALGGEPTSVSVKGKYAYAGVNTSQSYTMPSGYMAVVDLESRKIVAKCDVKGQPDSVATSPKGDYVAIAIENERDEDLNDGVIPQMPAGHLAIFKNGKDGLPRNCQKGTMVPMTGMAKIAPTDPEPEFVSINNKNEAVVTLQENNHIAIVDLKSGKVTKHFSAGYGSASAIPTKKARMSDASGDIKDVAREPDAVAWIDDDRFVTADEGDYKGGSRSFTIYHKSGKVLYSSGADMEHMAMETGHYPAKRAHKKGTEPEGVAVGTFDGQRYIFVNSERANFVAVYKDTGAKPEFVQFLPTHVKPEGLLTVAKRGLFVVANEKDDIKDKVRATVGIYKFGAAAPSYPTIISKTDAKTGAPIGWGAMSGLAADAKDSGVVYAVNDSFYDKSRIYTVDVSKAPAEIKSYVELHGGKEKKYDLEGVSLRKAGGFWVSSEGKTKKGLKHLLLQVAADGTVEKEINLPEALLKNEIRFGMEGCAEYMVGGKPRVIVAFQREWKDDPKGFVKLGIYAPDSGEWTFVHYPLSKGKKGWVGLSEISHIEGEKFALLERDNQGGPNAVIKQITMIDLNGVQAAPAGQKLPVVEKKIVKDLLPMMSVDNGWTPDKVEGLTIAKDGSVWAITDNDGVDDATGETMLMYAGSAKALF